jgi:hypothetical protein
MDFRRYGISPAFFTSILPPELALTSVKFLGILKGEVRRNSMYGIPNFPDSLECTCLLDPIFIYFC